MDPPLCALSPVVTGQTVVTTGWARTGRVRLLDSRILVVPSSPFRVKSWEGPAAPVAGECPRPKVHDSSKGEIILMRI
jgi:hypothetical protein